MPKFEEIGEERSGGTGKKKPDYLRLRELERWAKSESERSLRDVAGLLSDDVVDPETRGYFEVDAGESLYRVTVPDPATVVFEAVDRYSGAGDAKLDVEHVRKAYVSRVLDYARKSGTIRTVKAVYEVNGYYEPAEEVFYEASGKTAVRRKLLMLESLKKKEMRRFESETARR